MDYDALIKRIKDTGNFRCVPPQMAQGMIDFSSNDYLGLASMEGVADGFAEFCSGTLPPMTASASRLLSSRQQEYKALEEHLSELYGFGRQALLFNSGYHANTGLISALADRDTLVVSDKLVHASIIDGITLSRAEHRRFAHADYDALERILAREARPGRNIIVVVESVYSMDGDCADLSRLTQLRRRFDGQIMLYVDEAHAFGVCGPKGLGLTMEPEIDRESVDVVVGTFGKAAASSGAFAVMSSRLRDIAVNRARSFIFSTALPPVCVAWSDYMLGLITRADDRRNRLASLSKRLADSLAGRSGAAAPGFASHIYPFVVGDAERTVTLSHRLADEGLAVLPIRTPTVPAGTERLRISLSAAHTGADIDRLTETIIRHTS